MIRPGAVPPKPSAPASLRPWWLGCGANEVMGESLTGAITAIAPMSATAPSEQAAE